jgi:hypothetical protein
VQQLVKQTIHTSKLLSVMNGKDAKGGVKSASFRSEKSNNTGSADAAISQMRHISNMSDDLSAIQQFKIIAD